MTRKGLKCYIIMLSILTFITGCGTVEIVEFGGSGPKFTEPLQISENKSLIYFYRLPATQLSGDGMFIRVDDFQGVVDLTNGGWYSYEVSPGQHKIYSRLSRLNTPYVFDMELGLKAGEACYIRYKPVDKFPGFSAMWKGEGLHEGVLVSPDKAISEMKGLKRFQVAGEGGVKMLVEPESRAGKVEE